PTAPPVPPLVLPPLPLASRSQPVPLEIPPGVFGERGVPPPLGDLGASVMPPPVGWTVLLWVVVGAAVLVPADPVPPALSGDGDGDWPTETGPICRNAGITRTLSPEPCPFPVADPVRLGSLAGARPSDDAN